MNYRDVSDLIKDGEGVLVEFKRRISSPEKIARTLISFANTKGGTVLFGVGDDGSIIGVESEKTEVELIDIAGRDFCDPSLYPQVEIVPCNGRDVIVCQVPESENKPHFFLGERDRENGENTRVYIRVNDKTVMASREVVQILQNENPAASPLRITIGENERRLFRYLEKHERITVPELGRLLNISDRRASRMLVQLVRAGVIRIHTDEKVDFYTLAYEIEY